MKGAPGTGSLRLDCLYFAPQRIEKYQENYALEGRKRAVSRAKQRVFQVLHGVENRPEGPDARAHKRLCNSNIQNTIKSAKNRMKPRRGSLYLHINPEKKTLEKCSFGT
tara:strand:+ start:1004 stop:1330 length:327 start_codon:yes stop_codon:yes gene_type:complete